MASTVFYFSGGGGDGVWGASNECILGLGYARLVSHAYEGVAKDYLRLQQGMGVPATILVDSGAFTAWSQGKEVNREALATLFDIFYTAPNVTAHLINLDRIPGRKGVDPTPEQITAAMLESENNYLWLSKRFPGRVLPVYHQGEPVSYLRQLVEEADYLCLSPRNDLHEKLRVGWAQEMHARTQGKKTHGLATTGFHMLQSVPWHSVDSATWVMVAAYGGVFIPTTQGNMRVLSVSEKSSNLKELDAHLRNLPEQEQEQVCALFAEKGLTLEVLEQDTIQRGIWNVHAIGDWLSRASVVHRYQPGLFE